MTKFIPNNNNKPFPPYPPIEPQKPQLPSEIIDLTKTIQLEIDECSDWEIDGFRTDLHKIFLKIEELDIDVITQDVKLFIESEYNDGDTYYILSLEYKELGVSNPNYVHELELHDLKKKEYEKEMIKYKKEMEKFKLKYAEYEKNLKIWEEFDRQQEIKRLEKKLAFQ